MIETALVYLAKPLIKWGLIVLFIGTLAGLWQWERHSRIAAVKGEHAAIAERDMARADTQRWHDASDQRDLALQAMSDTLTRQNAAVQRLQFSLDQANAAAAVAEGETRDARTKFDRRIQQLEEEAHAHPDQVMPVGTIVHARVDGLWD